MNRADYLIERYGEEMGGHVAEEEWFEFEGIMDKGEEH